MYCKQDPEMCKPLNKVCDEASNMCESCDFFCINEPDCCLYCQDKAAEYGFGSCDTFLGSIDLQLIPPSHNGGNHKKNKKRRRKSHGNRRQRRERRSLLDDNQDLGDSHGIVMDHSGFFMNPGKPLVGSGSGSEKKAGTMEISLVATPWVLILVALGLILISLMMLAVVLWQRRRSCHNNDRQEKLEWGTEQKAEPQDRTRMLYADLPSTDAFATNHEATAMPAEPVVEPIWHPTCVVKENGKCVPQIHKVGHQRLISPNL